MNSYLKHLVECNCILPQFKRVQPPLFHKFVVFSEIDDKTQNLISTYVKCNNCGAVHRVYEVSKSEITKNENTKGIVSIDELKLGIPEKLSIILEKYEAQLPIWQEINFIIENKLWGKEIILAKESEDTKQHKRLLFTTLLIAGDGLFKINKREREIENE
ncbi:MAG TPA: hypothetical protein PLP33_23590 [Leptospiraceae bacterium]|jgi:hypothetical protein|nr:hypothetical protein [Leptospiraceae bacterium]